MNPWKNGKPTRQVQLLRVYIFLEEMSREGHDGLSVLKKWLCFQSFLIIMRNPFSKKSNDDLPLKWFCAPLIVEWLQIEWCGTLCLLDGAACVHSTQKKIFALLKLLFRIRTLVYKYNFRYANQCWLIGCHWYMRITWFQVAHLKVKGKTWWLIASNSRL